MNNVLKGRVVDETNQGIAFATVSLFQSIDSTLVTGVYTNENGEFNFSSLENDAYYLIVSHILYEPVAYQFVLTGSQTLDPIVVKQTIQQLDEVVVGAERVAIQHGMDKIVINPDKMINSAGGTALDIIKYAPSIHVDPQGIITLRGNSDIQILINGKMSGMAAIQGLQYLNELDANAIETIEIITNPTAAESPDGGAGIINIILKKEYETGLKGNLTASLGNRNRYKLAPRVAYRTDRFNLFLNYNFLTQSRIQTSLIEQNSNDSLRFCQHANADFFARRNNLEVGFDYFLKERQYFTFSGLYRHRSKQNNSSTQNTVYSNSLFSEYRNSSNAEPETNNGYAATIAYYAENEDHSTKTQVLVDFVHSVEEEVIDRIDEVIGVNPLTSYFDGGLSNYIDINDGLFIDASAKKLLDNGYYDLGGLYFFRNIKQTFDFQTIDSLSGTVLPEYLLSDQFDYNDHVSSIYGVWEHVPGKLKLNIGIRISYSYNAYTSRSEEQHFKNSFFNVFPSGSVAYQFSEAFTAQANFSKRINRPSPNRLNPFFNISKPFQVEFGNPDLDPEFINVYNLGGATTFGNTSLTVNVFWRNYQGLIQKITTIAKNGNRIIRPTNIETFDNYGADLTYSFRAKDFLEGNIGIIAFKNNFSSNEISNNGFTYQSKLNTTWAFFKNIDWQFSLFYNSRITDPQGITQPILYADTGCNYELLNKRLAISLNVSDIFNSQKEIHVMEIASFNARHETKIDTRRINISVKYKLNR